MHVQPFGRRIYIKPEEEKTLIQSDTGKNTVRGTVVSVGSDCQFIRTGDLLLFTSWGVDEVNLNGEKYYFLLETDEFILAILDMQETRVAPSVSSHLVYTDGVFRNVPDLPPEEILPSGQGGEAEQLQVPELPPEASTPAVSPEVQ